VDIEKDGLFSSMPERKAVVALAIPTIISQIITVIYNMADTFFVGQLGDPNQVAAATLAMPLFMFMTALANLFNLYGNKVLNS
jgi:Na+-driven multidrug efflux pump